MAARNPLTRFLHPRFDAVILYCGSLSRDARDGVSDKRDLPIV